MKHVLIDTKSSLIAIKTRLLHQEIHEYIEVGELFCTLTFDQIIIKLQLLVSNVIMDKRGICHY